MRFRLLFCFILLASSLPAVAQPLADRVPGDTLIYIGWRGSESMGPMYDQSHLKAVIDASNLPKVIDDFLPRVMRKLNEHSSPPASEASQLLATLGGAMWRHPSAVAFGGMDMTNPRHPSPRIALICDAGTESGSLWLKLSNFIAKNKDQLPFPIQLSLGKGPLTVRIGSASDAGTLAGNKDFTDAMAKVRSDAVAALYVDCDGLMKLVNTAVDTGHDEEAKQMWPKIAEALGLNGLKRIAWTGSFDGKDWCGQYFINAPAPRKGLLALMDGPAIEDSFLRAVPMDATLMAAGRFDLAELLTETRSAVAQIQPGAEVQFDKALGAASMMIGRNVQTDLAEPLGDQWLMYCAPGIGGNGMLGFTLVNHLRDPAKAEQGLNALELFANNMIAGQMHGEMRVAFKQTKIGDLKIHYLAVPLFSPSWTIADGNLTAALFPQTVSSAVQHTRAKNSTILENISFVELRKRLGPAAGAISYADLRASAGDNYPSVLMMAQLGLGGAELFGIDAPPMVLPPLDKLLPHLSPACSIAWADDTGLHGKSLSPFPGATILTTQLGAVLGSQSMAVSILLPSLNRARETANRVKCASNMRQIGMACLMYANEHKGKYPPDLGTLLLTQEVTIGVFTCPSSNEDVPEEVMSGKPEQMAAWINAHSPYVYLGNGKNTSMTPDDIVVYEKAEDHNTDGMNMLFGDGHVEFKLMSEATPLLEQQTGEAADGSKPKLPKNGGL